LRTLIKALENVKSVESAGNPTFDNGIGRFTVRYTGKYDKFVEQFSEAAEELSFEVGAEAAGRKTLVLEAKPSEDKKDPDEAASAED